MATLLSTPCVPTSFGIPSVFGLQILSVSASIEANYSATVPAAYKFTQPSILQPVGAGGWAAGRFFLSYRAMEGTPDGYAALTTDAGLGSSRDPAQRWLALANSSSKASTARARITPTGTAARKALFDSVIWPQQIMNMLGAYPHSCEMDALTAAAVSDCDGLDGVVNGVIGSVEACLAAFDPHAAAAVVDATWRGAVTAEGRRIWRGLNPGADLTGASPSSNGQSGTAATNGSGCGTCV
ncbi:hypothetical protein B0T25DRAFT_574903 [Lasiosphaeria hispida]|uniref:feruloyl esterase n=1 Tax=Lasiosphaeria hispida TaxID=260671 RepID=A0AAJ0H4Y4_9PEZI|nr:hypothetical protein B0T25DRAFT_574903 [Lasiosphaeria hispida]